MAVKTVTRLPIQIVRVEQQEERLPGKSPTSYLKVTFNVGSFGPYWIDAPLTTSEVDLVGLVEERAKVIQKVLMLTED